MIGTNKEKADKQIFVSALEEFNLRERKKRVLRKIIQA